MDTPTIGNNDNAVYPKHIMLGSGQGRRKQKLCGECYDFLYEEATCGFGICMRDREKHLSSERCIYE